MERLTFGDDEMMCNCPVKTTGDEDDVTKFCDQVCDEWQSNCPYMKMGKKLKHYEDLEDQGRLIEIPCRCKDCIHAGGTTNDDKCIYCTLHNCYMGKENHCGDALSEQALAERQSDEA